MNQHLLDNINLSGHEKVVVTTDYVADKGYQDQMSYDDIWVAKCQCGYPLVKGPFYRKYIKGEGYQLAKIEPIYMDNENVQLALQKHIQEVMLRQMAQAHIHTMEIADERADEKGNIYSAIPHLKDRLIGKIISE